MKILFMMTSSTKGTMFSHKFSKTKRKKFLDKKGVYVKFQSSKTNIFAKTINRLQNCSIIFTLMTLSLHIQLQKFVIETIPACKNEITFDSKLIYRVSREKQI